MGQWFRQTTTMHLSGYLMPTGGEIAVADRDMLTDPMEARRRIGYMPETVPLYLDMTVRSYLEFVAGLRGVNKRLVRQRVAEVTARCQLEDRSNVVLGRLSKGYRQRVGLAQAIVHRPVPILDDPLRDRPIKVATRQSSRNWGRRTSSICTSAGRHGATGRSSSARADRRGGHRTFPPRDAVRLLASGPADAVVPRPRHGVSGYSRSLPSPSWRREKPSCEAVQGAARLDSAKWGAAWKIFLGLTATGDSGETDRDHRRKGADHLAPKRSMSSVRYSSPSQAPPSLPIAGTNYMDTSMRLLDAAQS